MVCVYMEQTEGWGRVRSKEERLQRRERGGGKEEQRICR